MFSGRQAKEWEEVRMGGRGEFPVGGMVEVVGGGSHCEEGLVCGR